MFNDILGEPEEKQTDDGQKPYRGKVNLAPKNKKTKRAKLRAPRSTTPPVPAEIEKCDCGDCDCDSEKDFIDGFCDECGSEWEDCICEDISDLMGEYEDEDDDPWDLDPSQDISQIMDGELDPEDPCDGSKCGECKEECPYNPSRTYYLKLITYLPDFLRR